MALNPIEGGDDRRRSRDPVGSVAARCATSASSPAGQLPAVQVDCLLGGLEHPLPLGTMDEARPICNACTARSVWREDED